MDQSLIVSEEKPKANNYYIIDEVLWSQFILGVHKRSVYLPGLSNQKKKISLYAKDVYVYETFCHRQQILVSR